MNSEINLSTVGALHGAGASPLRRFPKVSGADRRGIPSGYSTAFLLFLITVPAWAQSVTIISPADGATVQAVNLVNGRALPLLVTVTEGSGNHTVRACATMNGRPINPQNCSYAAPWTVTAFPGISGDGPQIYQVTTYDISQNVLATSTPVTINARLDGFKNSITAAPTSGSGTISTSAWGGSNLGGGCGETLSVDGKVMVTGVDYSGLVCTTIGENWTGFDTTKWLNGNHEIYVTMNQMEGGGPFQVNNTFTTGNVSGNTITLTAPNPHYLVTNRPVVFSGTPPAPLVTGKLFTWATSATHASGLVTAWSASGGIISFSLDSVHGATAGVSKVDLREMWNVAPYDQRCAGLYTIATVPTTSSFTVVAPNCPDGAGIIGGNIGGPQVAINPYYAIYTSDTAAQFAATPNGSAITLTNTGSGTMTASYIVQPGYWAPLPTNTFDAVPQAFARLVVDFENGHTAMEYRPAFLEMNGIVGNTGPSLCGTVYYTDGLTPTSVTCSAVTYTVVPDGGFTGVVTVNATTGVPTYTGAGWAQITSTYSTFPAVTTYVHVFSGAVTQSHFTHDGHIATAFTPGQSFYPTSWWGVNCLYATPSTGSSFATSSLAALMYESGINTCFTGGTIGSLINPTQTGGCPTFPTTQDFYLRQWADAWKAKYGTPVSFEFDASNYDVFYDGPSTYVHDIGYNRHTCIASYLTDLKADGRTYRFFGDDEVNTYVGGANPNFNGAIGAGSFTSVVCAASVCTANVSNMSMGQAIVWNQATGLGAAVLMSGATTKTCMNGWHYVTGMLPLNTLLITSFTFAAGSCGSGNVTANAISDPSLLINYIADEPNGIQTPRTTRTCMLPKFYGSGAGISYSYQSFTQDYDPIVGNTQADTTLVSIVSDGAGTGTVTNTANGWADGHSFWISGATTAALNGVYFYHRVDANTGTFPTTAAAGTYNNSTDSGLWLSYDCALPNNWYSQLNTFFTSQGFTLAQPLLGSTYGASSSIANWNLVMSSNLVYHSDSPQTIAGGYGEDASVYGFFQALQASLLTTRAYQLNARGDLEGTGGQQYQRNHQGYLFNPALDNPNELFWRPETMASKLMLAMESGITSNRTAWFQGNNAGQYNLASGQFGGGNAIGPEDAKMWGGAARSQWNLQNMAHLELQPHANAPYLGPMFNTMATTSSYGNALWITCLVDGGGTYPYTTDLSGMRFAGGSIYRMSHTGYRTTYTLLAGNPTSDTYTHCGGGIGAAGETVAYVAQPAGASDLTPTTFAPPASLPYGASHYAIRYGYYPRDMADDPAQACDAGCTINLMRQGGPVWFQILYLNANNVPLAVGDAQMLAGQ